MKGLRSRTLAALCGLTVALAGCSVGAGPGTPTPTVYEMRHPTIVPTRSGHPDALYVPNPIRVHVGQTVTWTNRDTDPHDVTSNDGLFFSGPIGAGGTWSWRSTQPGTYPYFCTIHPEMHGEIVVSP